jgi:hypothetical protein
MRRRALAPGTADPWVSFKRYPSPIQRPSHAKDLQLIQPAAVSLTIDRRLVSGDVADQLTPSLSWSSLIVAWRWYGSALCAW